MRYTCGGARGDMCGRGRGGAVVLCVVVVLRVVVVAWSRGKIRGRGCGDAVVVHVDILRIVLL